MTLTSKSLSLVVYTYTHRERCKYIHIHAYIGLAKTFIWVFYNILGKNLYKHFGQSYIYMVVLG